MGDLLYLSCGLRRRTLGLLGLFGLWGLQWGFSLRSPFACLREGASKGQTELRPNVLLLSLGLTAKGKENANEVNSQPCNHLQHRGLKVTRGTFKFMTRWRLDRVDTAHRFISCAFFSGYNISIFTDQEGDKGTSEKMRAEFTNS